MSPEIICMDKANNSCLPWHLSLRNQKSNFRLIIYSCISTNSENLVKISLIDFEMIGVTEIVTK